MFIYNISISVRNCSNLLSHFIVSDDDSSSEGNNIQHETNVVLFSPNTQTWKVNALNETECTKLELNNQGPFKSPGKWNISSVSNDNIKLANVTRTLDLDENSKIVIDGEYYIHNSITIFKIKNNNLIYIYCILYYFCYRINFRRRYIKIYKSAI